jgi:hypothetical protein
LGAATLTLGSVLILVTLYWQGVRKGSLPSPTEPLAAYSGVAASNAPPVQAVAVSSASAAGTQAAPRVEQTTAKANESQLAFPPPPEAVSSTKAATVATVTNTSLMLHTEPLPMVPRRPTNLPAEDQRIARLWLENTNQRPIIRVRYDPVDILRLSTELGRGLLIAGNGTTNRNELFLHSKLDAAPLFSPFTRSVAQQFSNYSLALSFSSAFERVTRPLPAYFPDGHFELAFVPDVNLATEIFGKAANVLRSSPETLAKPNTVVLEGQLGLAGDQPVFEVLSVAAGSLQIAPTEPPSAARRKLNL